MSNGSGLYRADAIRVVLRVIVGLRNVQRATWQAW